jgi:CheY-like chemotaxis protein
MRAKGKSVRKVLFLDDNLVYLDMVERVFSGWSKGSWQFLRASNVGKAMAILDEQVVDLIVIDLHLPGVDGLQFLRLLQKRHNNTPKVVMTGQPDEESQAACLSSGADMYLEKPKSLDGMEGVFATLNELAKWQGDQGFRGVVRQISLPEVIQMECLNKTSSVLEIASGINRGHIFIREGEIIHAEGGGHKGEDALGYLLSLKGGEFNVKPYSEPAETTISGSWEGLVMGAVQNSDESGDGVLPKIPERATSTARIEDLTAKTLADERPNHSAGFTNGTDQRRRPRTAGGRNAGLFFQGGSALRMAVPGARITDRVHGCPAEANPETGGRARIVRSVRYRRR